jgi:hypothetical protein
MPNNKIIDKNFEDNILLKLHRQYSKDEVLGLFKAENAKISFRNGELKSANEELIHQNKLLKKKIELYDKTNIEDLIKKTESYKKQLSVGMKKYNDLLENYNNLIRDKNKHSKQLLKQHLSTL